MVVAENGQKLTDLARDLLCMPRDLAHHFSVLNEAHKTECKEEGCAIEVMTHVATVLQFAAEEINTACLKCKVPEIVELAERANKKQKPHPVAALVRKTIQEMFGDKAEVKVVEIGPDATKDQISEALKEARGEPVL
jgi:hypothetical protein